MDGKINLVLLNITVEGGFSGVNRYLETMLKGLENEDNIIVHTIYVIEKKEMLFPRIKREGERVDALIPLPVNNHFVIKDDFWMTKYAGVLVDMLDPYFRDKTNIIWNLHCINLSRLTIILKERHGGRILSYLHCIPWKFEIEGNPVSFNLRYRKFLNKEYYDFNDSPIEILTYDVADRIVCVTRSARFYLERCMCVPSPKIDVVTNGIEDIVESEDVVKHCCDSKIELLYVGRISKEKGVPTLLSALRKVKQAGYCFRLTLAGTGYESIITELKEKYTELELNFTGRLAFKELIRFYQECTIGLIPSLHEQCSYVAMEMAMFGVPLVVTDVDGLAEMFTDRKTALKVPLVFDDKDGLDVDVNKLAQAIIRLMKDRKLRDYLSKNVREHYLKHFTSGLMIKNSINIYKQMLS